MDNQVRGSLFKDQFVISTTPTPDIPTCLSTSALLALPYISLFIGIDARTPTKAVYALYDPEIAGLRFVHGDGTFVSAERVCFRSTFKDKIPNLNRSQRLHFMELMNRSVQHHRDIQECAEYRAKVATEFATASSVKSALTFVCKIKKGSCAATRDLSAPENIQDHAVPTVSLTPNQTWDFNPFGFQACVAPESDAELTVLRENVRLKYGYEIAPNNFQQALFCLAGLIKNELVPFVLEGQNNAKFFLPYGVTPPKPSKLLIPRRTSLDWTVDCFVARFGRYENLFNGGYERWPNPIAWLEAEMDREEIQREAVRPWRLLSARCEKEPMEPPVIDWETLQRLRWFTRGNYSQYPKSILSQKSQPLELRDVINPTTFRFKESTRARNDRKEKEKLAEKTKILDLTGNSMGHMNQPAARGMNMNDFHSGYIGDESELPSPLPRKRKHLETNLLQSAQQLDANETLRTSEHLQYSEGIKQGKAIRSTLDDDLYGVSDREEERRITPLSKRARYQPPPPKQFRGSNNSGIMIQPRHIKDEDKPLHTRFGFKDTAVTKSIFEPAQESSGFGARHKHIYSTSSPDTDSNIEIIETPGRELPMALKSPSHHPLSKSSVSSSFIGHKRNRGMQDRLKVFERQHKIPRREFDARYYERLHSPSSSPEALYPSIELAHTFSNNTPPSSNKRASATDRMVIDLESPEPEDQEIDAERSACDPFGMTSSEKGQGCIDTTDDIDTASPSTLSNGTLSRNGESMDELRSRMASFQVTGRRNSL